MLYCRKRNYNKTAFDIDQMTDLSKFSRFLNIERFAETTYHPNEPSVERARSTTDSENFKKKLNPKLLKIRERKKSNEKLPTRPVANAEQKPDEKNETLPTGNIKKILKSKNCTIGKLIAIS